MGNLATQSFTGNTTWTAPAGVTSVTIVSQIPTNNLQKMHASSFVIDPGGNLWAWGDNTNGQLGLGDTTQRSSPVLVLGGLKWQALASLLGSSFPVENTTIAIDSTGKAWAWGANSQGQLGVGDTTPRSSPVAILGGLNFSKIYVHQDSSTACGVIGLTTSGQAYGWGNNGNGRLGIGGATNQSSPVLVLGGLAFTQIVMNLNSTLGLSVGGTGYGWGNNTNGQLGNGTTATNTTSPVVMVGGVNFAQFIQPSWISSSYSMFGIGTDGTAYGWGQNGNGQLGDGTTTVRSSPVAVVGGLKFSQLVSILNGTTISSTLGLTTSGVAYGWGQNAVGQLGIGNTTDRSSPVAVLGGLKFSKLFTDNTHSVYGLQADGTLYAWGQNGEGQLGVGDVTPRSSPVAVVGGLKWASVNATFDQFVDTTVSAITNAGIVYGWGASGQGDIGDGTSTAGYSSPVQSVGTMSVLTAPIMQTVTLTVVPGTSYTLNMQQNIPTFGTSLIASGAPSLVTLYFEE